MTYVQRAWIQVAFATAALAFAGCRYQATPPGGSVKCGAGEKRCPDGYACYTGTVGIGCANTCWPVETQPEATTRCLANPDAATVDGASPDAPQVDAPGDAHPDAGPDRRPDDGPTDSGPDASAPADAPTDASGTDAGPDRPETGSPCIADGGVCRCTGHGDCPQDQFCSMETGQSAGLCCAPGTLNAGGLCCPPGTTNLGGTCKKVNGQTCATAAECASAFCCGTCTAPCASGTTCASGGCKKVDGQSCAAATECASGVCTRFYADSDGDGYPNASLSVLACGTRAPTAGYIPARSDGKVDCCDANSAVHPDVTTYFNVAASNCTNPWDYNCSGVVETSPQETTGCRWETAGCANIGRNFPATTCGGTARYDSCGDQQGVCLVIGGGTVPVSCR